MSAPDLYYPKLDTPTLKNLRIVKESMETHKAAYFLFEGCVYSYEIEQILTELFKPVVVSNSFDNHPVDSAELDLLKETENLYKFMRDTKSQLGGNSVDIPERMAYFKTMTQSLEKILALRRQAVGIKEVGDFYQSVINIMQEELTGAQRTKVIEKLKKVAGQETDIPELELENEDVD